MQAIERLLQQAVTHHQAGDLAAAEECCRRVLQLDPRHPKANHNLGALCVQQGRIADALPLFIAALEADPVHGQYWLSYIDALRQAGQLDEARRVLTLAREGGLQGEDVDALVRTLDDELPAAGQQYDEPQPEADSGMLVALFNQGRYEEAEAQARRMVAQDPHYGPAWKMLGVLLNRRGSNEQALRPMRQAAALLPEDAEAHNNLGIVLQRLNRLDEAEAAYRQALRLAPGYARACNNLGSLLMLDTKRLDEAVATCLQALEIEPTNADALYNLGMVFHLQERLNEAEAAFRYLLRLEPAHADGQYRLGNVLFGAGRKDEAESCYRAAVKLKPDHIDALNNLAVVLEDRKQLSEAEACCRNVLQLKPDSADAYNCLGVVLHGLKRPGEAEASYRRALELKPDLASAWSNLAVVLQSQGCLEEAVACCLRALQLRPDYAAPQINLGYLYCELDDLERAAAAFQRAVELDPSDHGLDAAVYLAVLAYLQGKNARCRELLNASMIAQLNDDRHTHVRGYWVYLDRLLSQLPQPGAKADTGTLYVVGESHSLSAHRLEVRYRKQAVRCMSEWILGCKQWHLGNGSNNKYKQKFDAVMARLPRASTILLAIGEIDCRHDEGIIRAWKKFPEKDLSDVARATVDAYMDYVIETARRHGHHFIVGGVPAPNVPLDTMPSETAQQLVFLIRRFNTFLKDRALSAGMEFLDVYALTDRGDGVADGQWYIDSYHLKPSAVAVAMEKYCLAAESGKSPASVKMRDRMTTTADTPMNPDIPTDHHTTEKALRDAVASHQAGQLQAAEAAYRAILQREPQHAKANHNLGALYVQMQQPQAALPFFAAALESDPAHGQYWLSYADALHQAGRTDEAREVLSLARRSGLQGEDVDALAASLEGGNPPLRGDKPGKEEVDAVILLFTQARLDEVVARAQALTQRFPTYGFGWKVLGVAFKQLGRNAEALAPMQKAVELLPGDAEAYSNLGGNLQDLGRNNEAEAVLKRAVQIRPDSADAQFNLGVTLQSMARLGEAESCFRKAFEAKPDFAAAHGCLGAVLQQLGRPEEALVHFRERARLAPGNPVDEHLIASLTGKNTERAPAKYVEDVFDSYAGNFDSHLQQTLRYETPKKLQALISSHAPHAGKWEVLDLGCGTGLAGVEIAPYAQRLVGVDLSSKMLGLAAARKLYQRLEQADLVPMMQREPAASYDVIVAADVFVYLGKLDEVVAEARRLLRPGGVFAFSVEDCDAQATAQDYQLKGTGRYGQSVAYLNRLAAANGYRVEVMEATQLRVDNGKPIMGRLCIWKESAAGTGDAAQLMQQAVASHQAGNLPDAERGYRHILQLQPGHAEANHNLGALMTQSGRPADALPHFVAALEADAARGQFWLSYIDALHLAGQTAAAREVLALARQHGLGGDDVDALEASLAANPAVLRPFCPVCGSLPAAFQPLPDFYRQTSLQHGFVHFGKGEMISLDQYSCSRCGAADRERIYALWIDQQLQQNSLSRSARIIHFAPEPALSQRLRQIFPSYETADFGMDGVDHKVDLQNLPFADESYDFFICSHVLEHVDSDDKALDELYRITRKGGYGILVAPVIVGLDKTVEDPSVKDAAGRWRLFGQDDHVRLYAHDDYVNKIRSHGFRLQELGEEHFGKDVFQSLGLTPTSILYVVSK